MYCPKCNSDQTTVLDTRPSENNGIRRRRECQNCAHRFTTYEYTVSSIIANNNAIRDEIKGNLMVGIDTIFNRPITDLEKHSHEYNMQRRIKNVQ